MIKLNGQKLQFSHFNDGSTSFTCQPPQLSGAKVEWFYAGDNEIIQLYFLLSHLKAHNCKTTLHIYYLPHARQDRCPSDEDVFTLKYFCNLINSLQLDKLTVFDPHSPVSAALLNNVRIQSPQTILQNLINERLSKESILAYPDASSMKKYSAMFLNKPFVFGTKERDWKSGKITNYLLCGNTNLISNNSVLIIDDIISTGGTIYRLAEKLHENGAAKIYVYASHIENTILKHTDTTTAFADCPFIERFFTTNSIYTGSHSKIEVIKQF